MPASWKILLNIKCKHKTQAERKYLQNTYMIEDWWPEYKKNFPELSQFNDRKTNKPYDPDILLLDISPREMKTHGYTWMFVTALFIIAKSFFGSFHQLVNG